jgi:hypothetical protein
LQGLCLPILCGAKCEARTPKSETSSKFEILNVLSLGILSFEFVSDFEFPAIGRQGPNSGKGGGLGKGRSLRQQHTPRHRPTADGNDSGFAVCHLPLTAFAAQLPAGLGNEAEAVQATTGELPTPGVER